MPQEIHDKSKGYLNTLQKHIKTRLKQKGSEQTGDALLEHDKYLASASYQIESIIDISGIIVAYPFYIMAMSHLQDGTPMHEIEGDTFEQLGSLSAFVGVMCGVSFTSAAGIPIKEILNTQERERKLNMLGRMYKHILRALVLNDLNKNTDITEISKNIKEEIRQTQEVLDNMAIFIEQKKALSASNAYSNNFEERQRNEDEIFEDTRTQLIYKERIKFLNELNTTVSNVTEHNRQAICNKLYKKIEDKKYASSRDILVELHRPTYESIPFNDKVFAHAQPIRADGTGAEVLNNYGVPAAREHYKELIELIAEIAIYNNTNIDLDKFKTLSNTYLKGTHLEGFFNSSTEYVKHLYKTAKSNRASAQGMQKADIPVKIFGKTIFTYEGMQNSRGFEAIKNDIAKKKRELVPYEDIFKNYGVRNSTSHYAILIDLIENLFAHKHPGINHANWIAIGNRHLKGTVLENFFKNPNAPHLQALFARADKQYEIYRAKRATDKTDNNNKLLLDDTVNLDYHTTHTMKQKIHAEDLARDIERKKEEIKFYQNQLRIINPADDAIDPWTFKELEVDSNDVETDNKAIHEHVANQENTDSSGSQPKHLTLQDPYSTQLIDRLKMLWAQVTDLGDKVSNFFKNWFRVNSPNAQLWDENQKLANNSSVFSGWFQDKDANTYGYSYKRVLATLWNNTGDNYKGDSTAAWLATLPIRFLSGLLFIGLFTPYVLKSLLFSEKTFGFIHRFAAYPYQLVLEPFATFCDNRWSKIKQHWKKGNYGWLIGNAIAGGVVGLVFLAPLSVPYAAVYFPYKLVSAILNFPTLLKTLKGSVDSLHVGVRNFQEGLNVTENDGFLKHLFYPVFKAISVPLVGIFELGFGFAYWLVGPFGKDNTVRKISAAINSQYHAQLVEKMCDWMDEKSEDWIILGYDFNFVKYLGLAILYPSILVNGALNWVYTIVERLVFSIPVVASFAGWVTYDNAQTIKNHEVSRRKGWEFSATVGTNMLVLLQKFFAQPFKNNWSWLGTAYKELDKKYDMNYYGNLGEYKNTVKSAHKYIVLPAMMVYATVANFFIGIGFSIASLMGFAPLLTFVSFTTSTIAAGVTLPLGFGAITVNAEVGASLLSVPMALEPINSTHDLYNNAAYEEFQRENIRLKEPMQKYRKYIRQYLIEKLQENSFAIDKTLNYQIALIVLEQQAYQLMPRVPMDKGEVGKHIESLFANRKINIADSIEKANLIASSIDKITDYLNNNLNKAISDKNSLHYKLTFISLTKYAGEKLFVIDKLEGNSLETTVLTDAIINKASHVNENYIKTIKSSNTLPIAHPKKVYKSNIINDLKAKLSAIGVDSIAYHYAKTILEANRDTAQDPIEACIEKGITVETIENLFKQAKSFESALTESQSPDSLTAMKLKKHDNRTQWSTECIEYAVYTRHGEKKCEDNEELKTKVESLANNQEKYQLFLAEALADKFAGNTDSRQAHVDYFKSNATIIKAVEYFYEQYKINQNASGKHNYAFFGFSELVVNRFVKIMADDRYRRSLENDNKIDTKRIYYIDQSGTAVPCETSIDSTGVLRVSLNGDSIDFTPKSFGSNLMQSSPWLKDRYTYTSSTSSTRNSINSNPLDPTRFIYSEPNNHVDLDLCLAALKKDFGDEVVQNHSAINNQKTDDICVEPKLNSTAVPMINWCKYSTYSPSAAHIEQTYKSRATSKA